MTMEKLRGDMTAFVNSLYEEERKVLVFGEGSVGAPVMMIGEAPGEQESLQGRPFVGKAGKNLDELLELSGIDRGELYITNAVKFRPTKRSAAGNWVNRAPTREEVELFLPFLKRELQLVGPELIVTLGNTPLKALLGPKATIGEVHGRMLQWGETALYPLYHPASLIYNRSLRPVYEADVRRLGEWMRNGQ